MPWDGAESDKATHVAVRANGIGAGGPWARAGFRRICRARPIDTMLFADEAARVIGANDGQPKARRPTIL